MKYEIDLSKYGYLEREYSSRPAALEAHLDEYLRLADRAINAEYSSKEVFGMPMYKFIELMADIFFDWEGILGQHYDEGQKEALSLLAEDNHPLQVLKGKSPAYNTKGNRIELKQFNTADDLADLVKGALYSLRFGNQKELTQALMLDDTTTLNNLKAHNIQALIKANPALQFQKENNIPLGKRITRTKYFDCGEVEGLSCLACSSALMDFGDYAICNKCEAGFTLKEL